MSIFDNIKKAFTGGEEPEESTEPAHHHHHHAEAEEEVSPETYIAALEAQRAEKDRYFRSSAYSPLEPEDQQSFTGLSYYPPDPAFQYTLPLQRAEDEEPLTFQTSTGDEQTYYRAGTVEFEVDGEPARLAIYRSAEHDELFLPFRDATSGKETYGAGRYLEPIELAEGMIVVDFNLAYNPYCAYSPAFSCPLPPIENWLKVPIRAGEKNYKESDSTD